MFVVKRHITIFDNSVMTFIRTDEDITYKVQRTYTDNTGANYTFNFFNNIFKLSELQDRPDFSDYISYGLYVREDNLANLTAASDIFNMATKLSWPVSEVKQQLDGMFSKMFNKAPVNSLHFVNMTAMTLPTKTNLSGLRNIISGVRLMHMFFPLKTTPLKNVPLSVVAFPGMTINSNEEVIPSESDALTTNEAISLWTTEHCTVPVVSITGPTEVKKDKSVELSISITDKKTNMAISEPIDIYVENVNGYVPYSKITVKNGSAILPVSSMLLKAGDKITVKIGFKFYTNVCEHVIDVI